MAFWDETIMIYKCRKGNYSLTKQYYFSSGTSVTSREVSVSSSEEAHGIVKWRNDGDDEREFFFSFSFLLPPYCNKRPRQKKKHLETEQIAQWSSLLASCLEWLMFMPMWERPDRVCPNPQAVLSSSGTQAMCFRGKPHKRELAGGRMFQKKPGHYEPRHQLETQLDVVNKSNYGNGGGNLRVNWKKIEKESHICFITCFSELCLKMECV